MVTTTKHSAGITPTLAIASGCIGSVLGFLGGYTTYRQSAIFNSSGFSPLYIAVAYLSLATTYPITLAVFYVTGRKSHTGYITGGQLLGIYGGALLGEILGQVVSTIALVGTSSSALGFSLFTTPFTSLNFLFIATCGFALSNLSGKTSETRVDGKDTFVLPLAALGFGATGSFILGWTRLLGNASQHPNVMMIAEVGLLDSFVVGFWAQIAVFYLVGRKYPLNGVTYRYFGLLFAGLYVGGFIGATLSVALYGQNSWVLPGGQFSSSFYQGVLYQNTSPSLLVLLESLNPIGALPIVAFFAMSISRGFRAQPLPVRDVPSIVAQPDLPNALGLSPCSRFPEPEFDL